MCDPKKRKEYDSGLAPEVSEKIQRWEDYDSFWDKQIGYGAIDAPTSTKRPRSATFGQTTTCAKEALFQDALEQVMPAEASVKEVIRSQSKKRIRKILIVSLGLLIIGAACVSAILLNIKSPQKIRGDSQSTQQRAR